MKLEVCEPLLKSDYKDVLKLVEECIVRGPVNIEELKKLSSGEMLVAKMDSEVVGMLTMRRPGKIFKDYDEKYFSIDKYKVSQEKVGYIELIVVAKEQRRLGVATKLVNRAIEIQKEFGSRAIGVLAWQGSPNQSSQKLFESFNFLPLDLHKSPWLQFSQELGAEGYWCPVCGNPCSCDDLEMILYL